MKNTKKQRNIAILLGLILLFTIIWVISSVYHSYINSTIEIPLSQSITPIEGTFDKKTIDQIKSRKRVNISNDTITLNEEVSTPTAQLDTDVEIENGTSSAEIEL